MRYVALSIIIAILGVVPASLHFGARAQVMESDNFHIQSDSINFGGGLSTSSSYSLEDTLGEIATGDSDSDNYAMRAGYQQMQEVYLAMTSPDDVTMTPAIGGVSGGTANGSTTVTVTTDGAAGYQLLISGEGNPALQSDASSIPDYAPAGANPDFAFAVTAGLASFGFSPEGTDIAARFKDNGAACNTGSGDTSLACWDGLSTTDEVIAERTTANHPAGTETTLNFRVGVGLGANVLEGIYTATTTVTALAL